MDEIELLGKLVRKKLMINHVDFSECRGTAEIITADFLLFRFPRLSIRETFLEASIVVQKIIWMFLILFLLLATTCTQISLITHF